MAQNRLRLILAGGFISILAGTAVFIYLYFFYRPVSNSWQIDISGNTTVSEKEIRDVVLYLIRVEKGGMAVSDIRETLLLDPRISEVDVELPSERRMRIEIKENRTLSLRHTGTSISELTVDGIVIQEKLTNLGEHIKPDIPIFYLTNEDVKLKRTRSVERDIIQLWQSTRRQYAFLWDRISEIHIRALRHNVRGPGIEIRVYASTVRSRIIFENRLTRKSLRQLWAVFYYLEKNLPSKWSEVEIYETNAIIREKSA